MHRLPCLLCMVCAFCMAPVNAQVRAQPPVPLDAAPLSLPPMRIPGESAPVMRADTATPPLSAPGANRAPLSLPAADNPTLDAEIARLRTSALASPPAGSRINRSAANASWMMGLLYVHGIGVVVNLADAAFWFERASALGEPLAAAGLAWCEIEGCKGSPNSDRARRWIAALRNVNRPKAQYLQWLLESRLRPLEIATPGRSPKSLQATAASNALLLSAAEAGDLQARIELGFENLAGDRNAEALKQFRAAAPQSAVAAANAAQLTEAARKPQTSEAPQSAAETLARAQRNHRGDGQPANFVEAIRLYRLAQSQGSTQAKKMLEQIFSRPAPDGQIDLAWMQQLAYANFSMDVATFESPANRSSLKREATPLFDLLPPNWKRYSLPAPRR